MSEWTKKKGGWTRVINDRRENLTDAEYESSNASASIEYEIETLSRKEVQAKAKELGIPANQTSEVLLELIEKTELVAAG